MYSDRLNVLIVVVIPTHFKEMCRVACLLKNSGGYHPILYFQRSYPSVEKDLAICDLKGLTYRAAFTEMPTHALAGESQNAISTHLKKVMNAIARIKSPAFLSFKWNTWLAKRLFFLYGKIWESVFFSRLPGIKKIKEQYYNIQREIFQNDIKLIILPEDNLFYLSPLYLSFSVLKQVPTIIIPFTIANTNELAETFYPLPIYHADRLINKLVISLFPSWMMRYKDKKLVIPIQYILAYEYLKMAPKTPWILNGNDIDALMVENKAMYQYYLQSGVQENKLKLTGSLYDDELYYYNLEKEKLRENFNNKYTCHPDKPIILCALPPNQFQMNRPNADFTSYDELIAYLFSALQLHTDKFNVVVNPHPRSTVNDNTMSSFPNIIIASEDVTALIPISKIYIAFSSATIRMAIAAEVPVLNYDVYHYYYEDFINVLGVVEVIDKASFETSLAMMCLDEAYYADLKSKQTHSASQWSMSDGKSGERILSEIKSVLLRKKSLYADNLAPG